MVIGTLKVRLALREAGSLKDRRRVVKGLKDRLRHRFNVAVAEVGERNRPRSAALGICTVGMERPFLNQVLSQVLNTIRATPGAELIDEEMEFF